MNVRQFKLVAERRAAGKRKRGKEARRVCMGEEGQRDRKCVLLTTISGF